MFHAILAAPAAKRSVTPVMFGDKLGVGSRRNCLRLAGRTHLEGFPFVATPPRKFDFQVTIEMFDFGFHRYCEIIFAVTRARDERDRAPRDKFTNENYTAPPCVSRFPPHIETQIHFFEIAVQRDGKAEESRVEKEKSDHA